MNSEILAYYKQKEPEIKSSISQLFPKQCSDAWIRKITNRSELSWDVDTLQTSFLDPINHYLQNKPNYFYSLGGILFLEASGIQSDKFHLLITISEVFDSCFTLFQDIAIYNPDKKNPISGLGIDDAIAANVGVALLTLPYYPVIFGLPEISGEIRLWLFQHATQYVERILYANGSILYRNKSKIHFTSEGEYAQNACYLAGAKIQFNLDLWLLMTSHYKSRELCNLCNELVRHAALSYKIQSDLHSVRSWLTNTQNPETGFEEASNFVLLYLSKTLNIENLYKEPLTHKRLSVMINETNSDHYTSEVLSISKVATDQIIGQLPFQSDYKEKIKNYISLLINSSLNKK